MPTPAKTSRAGIVDAAYALLAAEGPDGLTMQAVADRVGVRAPSLYKHFRDRAALLRAVETDVLMRLQACLTTAAAALEDAAALRAMAAAYRTFALAAPHPYALILTTADAENDALRADVARPVLDILARRLGDPDAALARARGVTAFLHGFVCMEAAGAFRLGGDIDRAFADAIDLFVRAPGTP
jgi:AcrR family transcriptional regulator